MAIQKQNLPIKFTDGVDTANDGKLIIPSKFTRLENLELHDVNTVRQRPGYTSSTLTAHTGSNGIVNMKQLEVLGGELIIEAESGLHTLLQNRTASRDLGGSVRAKTFTRAQVDYRDVVETAQGPLDTAFSFDCAADVGSGLECWVWSVAGLSLMYRVVEISSRAIVQEGALSAVVAALVAPRVITRNVAGVATFYIYFMNLSSGFIQVRTLTVAAGAKVPGALSAVQSVVAAASRVFDCWYDLTGTGVIALAYVVPGTTFLALKSLSATDGYTTLATSTAPAVAGVIAVSVTTAISGGGTTYITAVYHVGTAVLYAHSMTTAGTGSLATTIIAATGAVLAGRIGVLTSPFAINSILIFYDLNLTGGANSNADIAYAYCTANGSTPGNGYTFARGVVLAARPAGYTPMAGQSVDVCVTAALLSDVQPTIFALRFGGSANLTGFGALVNYAPPRMLARIFPSRCGALNARYGPGLRMPAPLAVS